MNKAGILTVFALSLFFSCTAYSLAQTVDILWQGEGYVPPFYSGRTLWAKQSEITFTAIPQGLGNPANLNYSWSKNGTVLGLISGVGKNSISLVDTIFSKPMKIKVEIVDGLDQVITESSINISSSLPLVTVYEDNPLYGVMFHREVFGSFKMTGDEAAFKGFPYYFSVSSANSPSLSYAWKLNGKSGEKGNSIVLRVPPEGYGYTDVSLSAMHPSIAGQKAERKFLVQFGKNEQ
jgi:hypothetical protein